MLFWGKAKLKPVVLEKKVSKLSTTELAMVNTWLKALTKYGDYPINPKFYMSNTPVYYEHAIRNQYEVSLRLDINKGKQKLNLYLKAYTLVDTPLIKESYLTLIGITIHITVPEGKKNVVDKRDFFIPDSDYYYDILLGALINYFKQLHDKEAGENRKLQQFMNKKIVEIANNFLVKGLTKSK